MGIPNAVIAQQCNKHPDPDDGEDWQHITLMEKGSQERTCGDGTNAAVAQENMTLESGAIAVLTATTGVMIVASYGYNDILMTSSAFYISLADGDLSVEFASGAERYHVLSEGGFLLPCVLFLGGQLFFALLTSFLRRVFSFAPLDVLSSTMLP